MRRPFLTLEAMFELSVAWIRVRSSRPAPLARHLQRLPSSPPLNAPPPPFPPARTTQVLGAIDRGSRHLLPLHFTCLMRALAAHAMLTRRGLPSSLILGVRTERHPSDGTLQLKAHAWWAADPDPAPDASDGFTPIARYPPGPRDSP